MEIVAVPAQTETQKLNPMRKPATGPKLRSTSSAGPIGPSAAAVSRARTWARHNAPAMVMIQPNTAFQPNGARLAGKRNTPEPIMLPMTSATVIHRPSLRTVFVPDGAAVAVEDVIAAGLPDDAPSRKQEGADQSSELAGELYADDPRADDRVIKHAARSRGPACVTADGFIALDARVNDPGRV